MSGVLKIEIIESIENLKEKLKKERNSRNQQKIQVLYWLKTKQAESVEHLAVLAGKHRTTISRWLSQYRVGGIEELLLLKKSPGRSRVIPPEVEEKLKEELKDKEGFSSYKEIQTWLKVWGDLDVDYKRVHQLVRYRLKAKLKVPRPVHIKQNPGAADSFKKTLEKTWRSS